MTDLVQTSKFLSLVLRHAPERIGLVLDSQGWVDVDELLRCAAAHGARLDRGTLDRVVYGNDEQRFAFSPDGRRIRASQGHSVAVDLDLPPREPPETLFHGTATRFLESIRTEGLRPGNRRHVHLSRDAATAETVGQRHGRPVVLVVRSGAMWTAGQAFWRSDNQVWLAERVPPEFLVFPE